METNEPKLTWGKCDECGDFNEEILPVVGICVKCAEGQKHWSDNILGELSDDDDE